MQAGGGGDQCLQVSAKDESTVVVGLCTGAKREQWRVNGSAIQSAFGGCVDGHATTPANPQYGPLVVAPCEQSKCGGSDHKWKLHPTTKQLVSAVPGILIDRFEEICIESQMYGNHYRCNPPSILTVVITIIIYYTHVARLLKFEARPSVHSTLNGVGCAPASGPIPRAQQFSVSPEQRRVSVDVRFDQAQTGRAVGMLLCVDIDFSAPQVGAPACIVLDLCGAATAARSIDPYRSRAAISFVCAPAWLVATVQGPSRALSEGGAWWQSGTAQPGSRLIAQVWGTGCRGSFPPS